MRSLRVAFGFETICIARAFLSDERTVAQRIVGRSSGYTMSTEALRAVTCSETDWSTILQLYDRLQALRRSVVVDVKRAFVVAMCKGAGPGLDVIPERDLSPSDPGRSNAAGGASRGAFRAAEVKRAK